MKRATLALSTIVVIGCTMLTSGCATMQSLVQSAPKPSAAIKAVHFKKASWTALALVFDVEVTNPYDVALPLVKMDYSLTGSDQRLLTGAAPLTGSIPGKQSAVVALPADVDVVQLVQFFRGLRSGSTVPYTAALNMTVDAPTLGPLTLPITRSGELSVPAVPGL